MYITSLLSTVTNYQLIQSRVGRERYDFVNVCYAKMNFWIYLLVSCAVFVKAKAGKKQTSF